MTPSDSNAFRALVLEEGGEAPRAELRELTHDDLPAGDVLVAVSHSGLNYKDGMILNGLGRLVRQYPHIPGIDLAGTVLESADARYQPGDAVLLTGWGVGERHWGGYAERARVAADWLVPLPAGWGPEHAMAVGTAGFTAMLAIRELAEHGITPESGEVLVTGASGGVGSIALMLLQQLGYTAVAATGRPENTEYLGALGAARTIGRDELAEPPGRPLLGARWAGAIDTVGGETLGHLLAEVDYAGAVAACGLAGGSQLNTTVLPFLLRGVRLLGIDSVMYPAARRPEVWARLAELLPPERLEAVTTTIGLDEVPAQAGRILQGAVRGRTVVRTTA